MLWTDERQLPPELLHLLDMPETPKQLWILIAKARDEINLQRAVTYPTKANIEGLFLEFILNVKKQNNT
jgi:hypothetical protein